MGILLSGCSHKGITGAILGYGRTWELGSPRVFQYPEDVQDRVQLAIAGSWRSLPFSTLPFRKERVPGSWGKLSKELQVLIPPGL